MTPVDLLVIAGLFAVAFALTLWPHREKGGTVTIERALVIAILVVLVVFLATRLL